MQELTECILFMLGGGIAFFKEIHDAQKSNILYSFGHIANLTAPSDRSQYTKKYLVIK